MLTMQCSEHMSFHHNIMYITTKMLFNKLSLAKKKMTNKIRDKTVKKPKLTANSIDHEKLLTKKIAIIESIRLLDHSNS